MGTQVLVDREHGKAVFYCTTTNRPFGPVMERDEAEILDVVLEAHGKDPRVLATEPRNNDEGSALDEWREHVGAAFKLLCVETDDITGDLPGHVAWGIAHDYRERFETEAEWNAFALLSGHRHVEGAKEALREALYSWDVVL